MLRYRLSFLLPTPLAGTVRRGRHAPSADGISIVVGRGDLVQIEAPTRKELFDHASAFVREAAKRSGPRVRVFPATLYISDTGLIGDARDDLWISVGADVVFARDVFARSGSTERTSEKQAELIG